MSVSTDPGHSSADDPGSAVSLAKELHDLLKNNEPPTKPATDTRVREINERGNG